MHKLQQTIVTSDIDNFDQDRETSAIPNKPITNPNIAFNPRQDRTGNPQFLKHLAYNQQVKTKVTT